MTVDVTNGSTAPTVAGSIYIADWNGSCSVDGDDLLLFIACAAGPSVPLTGNCTRFDLNGDTFADQQDFAIWQRCYFLPGTTPDPACIAP